MNLFKMFPKHNEVRFSTLKLMFVDAGQFKHTCRSNRTSRGQDVESKCARCFKRARLIIYRLRIRDFVSSHKSAVRPNISSDERSRINV